MTVTHSRPGSLPPATVTLHPYEAWLGHEAMGVPQHEHGTLDLLWILVVGLCGIAGVIEFGQLGPADSVMFGGLELEQHVPLRVGIGYRVTGAITGVERYTGKQAGVVRPRNFPARC